MAPSRLGTDLLTPRARLARVGAPLLLAAGIALASVALHLRDPHESSWVTCPLYELTGRYCPGCGGLRAVNDLTHGDVLAAASSNLLFVVSIPLLVYAWTRWVRAEWTGRGVGPIRQPYAVACVVLGAAFVFTVIRNTGWGSWLQP